MSIGPTLDERILAYLDGDCTPTDVAELEQILASDPAARERYARLCEQDAAMRQILSCGPSTPASARRARPRRGAWRRPSGTPIPWIPISIAAAGLFIIILLASGLSSGPYRPNRHTQAGARQRPAEPEIVPIEVPKPVPPPAPRPEPEIPKPVPPAPKPDPAPEPKPPEPVRPEPAKPQPPAPKPDLPAVAQPPDRAKEGPTPAPVEPKPAPPPAPAPKTTEVVTVMARVDKIKGQVQVLAGNETSPAKDGLALLPGQGVQTTAESSASVQFLDKTQLDLAPETRVNQISNGAGKNVALALGTVIADVKRQPAGQPMVIKTPHAEARILGTRFTLTVSATETRLDVREGRVKLTRLSDEALADVTAGNFAVASEFVRPVARRIGAPAARFTEGFDTLGPHWQNFPGGYTTTAKGALEIEINPRPDDPYPGTWHIPGGARTKEFAFRIPFRLSIEVTLTHRSDDINAMIVFAPKSTQNAARNAEGSVPHEVAVRLRGGKYSLMLEGKHNERDRNWTTAQTQKWTIDFDLKEVRFFVDGQEVVSQKHGITIPEDYRIELQGTSKPEPPAGARVKFDTIRIEP